MSNCLLFSLTLSAVWLSACDRVLYSEETKFMNGYSEQKFRQLKQGMSPEEVRALMGAPWATTTQSWSEVWSYFPRESQSSAIQGRDGSVSYNLFGKASNLRFAESGIVAAHSGDYLEGDFKGLTKQQVVARIGEPTRRELKQFEIIYHYTKPGKSGTYKKREVHFDSSSKVISTVTAVYYD